MKGAQQAEALAPGHITGFFSIEDEAAEAAAVGSIGAGFSVELGCVSRVVHEPAGRLRVETRMEGEPFEADTTRRAVQAVVAGNPGRFVVDQFMGLPVGQGFGMSAAGALSAAMAAAELVGKDPEDALMAAHAAEVEQRTGLGDVVGSWIGGFEVRLRPGVPPHGRIERFHEGGPVEVLFAVAGEKVPTPGVLRDPARRAAILASGRRAVAEFSKDRSLESFAHRSRAFAGSSGLMGAELAAVLEGLPPATLAAQCMLGQSLFVLRPTPGVEESLGPVPWRVRTRVAQGGARVTRPAGPV